MEDPIHLTTEAPSLAADNIAQATQQANATTKFEPTPEGMACAYISIMIMALLPIFVGSFKSIKRQTETHQKCRETGEQAETMTDKDAMIFPLIASCALFGFYILIKLCPELVNYAISGYFFILGIFAIFWIIKPTVAKVFPKKYNSTQYTFLFGSKEIGNNQSDNQSSSDNDASKQSETDRSGNTSPSGSNTSIDSDAIPTEIMVCNKFTPSDIFAFVLALALGVWYILTKHWVANNAFGLAFALNGIEFLPINSVRIGCILLGGLFFYDVFWVFGTDVMVSVAKKFDAPIKVIFPQDFLVSGFWGKNFAMLGLGDIVIPGIFIAFLLRFDHSLKRKTNVYFWSCFLAYIFGLGLTIVVMTYFKHAQPALLYLVPCCVLTPLIVALIKGDVKALFKYRDHPYDDKEAKNEDNEHDDEEESKIRMSTRSISSKKNKKEE